MGLRASTPRMSSSAGRLWGAERNRRIRHFTLTSSNSHRRRRDSASIVCAHSINSAALHNTPSSTSTLSAEYLPPSPRASLNPGPGASAESSRDCSNSGPASTHRVSPPTHSRGSTTSVLSRVSLSASAPVVHPEGSATFAASLGTSAVPFASSSHPHSNLHRGLRRTPRSLTLRLLLHPSFPVLQVLLAVQSGCRATVEFHAQSKSESDVVLPNVRQIRRHAPRTRCASLSGQGQGRATPSPGRCPRTEANVLPELELHKECLESEPEAAFASGPPQSKGAPPCAARAVPLFSFFFLLCSGRMRGGCALPTFLH
jgi:hypothetical protein